MGTAADFTGSIGSAVRFEKEKKRIKKRRAFMVELIKASNKLSQLNLKMTIDNLEVDVLWFRAMFQAEEWFINRHRHSSFEFHFIHSGACRVILDDRDFCAGSGDFYLTGPGVFHRQESLNGEGFVEYALNCELKLLDPRDSEAKWMHDVFRHSPCRCLKDEHNGFDLFTQALTEAEFGLPGFYSNIRSLVAMMLFAAARAMEAGTERKFTVPVRVNKNDNRIRQIEKYIEDNIYSPICPEDIARIMFLSTRQISRIIKQSMGMNTKEFIDGKKHEKAKDLLRNSELSIQEISGKLGFSSEYYFSTFFKRHEGQSPSEFRMNTYSFMSK